MKILRIYDNGGKTIDRYTVYYDDSYVSHNGEKLFNCLAMSDNPFHPQGFCQHSGGQLGRHNGKRITFDQLPLDCQKAVYNDLIPFKVKPLAALKHKCSSWRIGFANKVYTVIDTDQIIDPKPEKPELLLVLQTGKNPEIDYQLVYPDEVKTIEND